MARRVGLPCLTLCLTLVLPPLAAAQPVPPARLSVSTGGTEANDSSFFAAASSDGRHVLFASAATNLVPGDTNNTNDLFIRDRDTDRDGVFDEAGAVATIRVNEGLAGQQMNDNAVQATLSQDGRFVLFSTGSALVAEDTNAEVDAYLRDRDTDGDGIFDEAGTVSLTRVSTGSGGFQASGIGSSMTPDGRFVLFFSRAGNLYDRPVATGSTTARIG